MDDDVQPDSESADLSEVVNILTPLRQHRQASAERRQRDLQALVERTADQLEAGQRELQREREHQGQQRAELTQINSLRTVDLTTIDVWHAEERRLLHHLDDMEGRVALMRDNLTQLKTALDQARLHTKSCQRAVEKLGCLIELLEHAS